MSIIQSALSAKTTSMSEAGNAMMFLLTITVAVYLLTFALITPYTNMTIWIYILSCIPLISNFFIPAILIIGQATTLQIIVSLVLLVISIPISFNICSKIFKNGVLDYRQSKKKRHKAKKELSLLEEQELKIEKEKFKRLGFVVGLSIILFIVLEVILDFLLDIFLVPVLSNFLEDTTVNLIYQTFVSALALGIASYFVHLYIPRYEKNKALNKEDSKKLFISSICLVALLQIGLIVIQSALGIENNISEVLLDIQGLDNPINCILLFIEIAIAPAIFEELFFRKSLIDLTRNFGDKFAVVFSSLIFAVSHLNIYQAIFAFFMGLILGTLYVKTGSMKYNGLLHLANNGYAVIAEILIFNELSFFALVFEMLILAIVFWSAFVFIEQIIEKIKNKEKIIWLKGNIIPKNFKYIFTDYTAIVSIIFTSILFTATELILKLL